MTSVLFSLNCGDCVMKSVIEDRNHDAGVKERLDKHHSIARKTVSNQLLCFYLHHKVPSVQSVSVIRQERHG